MAKRVIVFTSLFNEMKISYLPYNSSIITMWIIYNFIHLCGHSGTAFLHTHSTFLLVTVLTTYLPGQVDITKHDHHLPHMYSTQVCIIRDMRYAYTLFLRAMRNTACKCMSCPPRVFPSSSLTSLQTIHILITSKMKQHLITQSTNNGQILHKYYTSYVLL